MVTQIISIMQGPRDSATITRKIHSEALLACHRLLGWLGREGKEEAGWEIVPYTTTIGKKQLGFVTQQRQLFRFGNLSRSVSMRMVKFIRREHIKQVL